MLVSTGARLGPYEVLSAIGAGGRGSAEERGHMSLAAGARLRPYEVVALLGSGGMGEVYKARDTRLDGTVAINVLPPEVSADPDRCARFQHEAKTIAGPNDSRICTLYDVGEHDGSMFLVMEHVVGETLASRLNAGPLPVMGVSSIG
jgi:serine/threonine protein kinase